MQQAQERAHTSHHITSHHVTMRMQTLGNNNNNFLLNNKFNLALERTRGGTAPPLLWQL